MHVGAATAAVIAVAGLVVGFGGLALAWASWLKISRTRDAQKHVLGGSRRDVIDFAVSLQTRIDDLHGTVDEIAAGLARLDRRIDQGLTNVAVVRYDAYEDTGGHQSASVAMLDATRTGVVITAITGREHARIYVKDLERGVSAIPLSPEESDAVERAMGR